MKNKALPIITLVLLIAILGVVGYKLSPRDTPTGEIRLPVSACNPSTSVCTADLPEGGQLTFSVEPRPIKPLQPLHLKVTTTGREIQRIEVDFNGTDMDMGRNRVSLSHDDQGFSGQAMLPVCVTGTMSWNATLLLTAGSSRLAVPFHFVVAGR